jgi:hypothetical protein
VSDIIAAMTKNTSTTHFALNATVQGGENENDFMGNAGNHDMLLN